MCMLCSSVIVAQCACATMFKAARVFSLCLILPRVYCRKRRDSKKQLTERSRELLRFRNCGRRGNKAKQECSSAVVYSPLYKCSKH